MRYAIRIGPFESGAHEGQCEYIALANEEGFEGIFRVVEAGDDDEGLRALAREVGEDGLLCEPALAGAAERLGLPVGAPLDLEVNERWKNGLALTSVIRHILAPDVGLEHVLFFQRAASGFERAARVLVKQPKRAFEVRSTGAVSRELCGIFALNFARGKLSFLLFPDAASRERFRRLVHAGLSDEAHHEGVRLAAIRDQFEPAYLREALAWIGLERMYLPVRMVEGQLMPVDAGEMLLLSGILRAFAELGEGDQASATAEVDDAELQVELKLVEEPEPKPTVPPNPLRM